MRRRALLGTIASLAVAGCTGTGAQPSGSDSTTTTRATSTSTTQPTTTSDATPAELLSLGVPTTQSECPLGDEGRAVCYPEQTGEILSLTPDDDELDLPTDSTTFTLANDTDYEYHANFYGWKLSKRVHGQWFHVAPQYWPQPLHMLPAGESHEWSFTVDNSETPTGGSSSDSDVALAGLGGGEYAFTLQGWFPLGDKDSFHVALGARFRLNGDQLELTPTDDVSASRDGDTVVVTTGEEPGEDEELSAFVVEREGVPAGRPLQRYVTEQLLRPGPGTGRTTPYRNTIPFFEEGVETVRLEAPDATVPPFGIDEPVYVEYEDEQYEVTSERPA
ncbi:hypothetical protein [Halobacterium wangiae]|uniref:hypothetical protein n=1 Tax=Halobacterium wangiae TaxID=2902623 RepID=UPI001E4E7069|nr:hypothetical protein [Halobacterium wangiae]